MTSSVTLPRDTVVCLFVCPLALLIEIVIGTEAIHQQAATRSLARSRNQQKRGAMQFVQLIARRDRLRVERHTFNV